MVQEKKRRVPRQKRSQQRYQTILDVAAQQFATQGFETTTMEAIAAEAGTSIGSLYQFFPNKIELFRAMAHQYVEHVEEIFPSIIEGVTRENWSSVLDGAVDFFAELWVSDPVLKALWVNFHLYEEVAAEDEALLRKFIASIDTILSRTAPELMARKRQSVATTLVRTIQSMLLMSSRENPNMGLAILEETKIMLKRYLEPYLFPSQKSRKDVLHDT